MKNAWLLLLAGYSGFIFYLSHQAVVAVPALFLHQDKLFHAAAYALLAFLSINYFNYRFAVYRNALLAAFVFCALYGASDEWHQSFINGREADILDWLADCIGATIMLLAYKAFRGWRTAL